MVMACDGLWDVISNDECIAKVTDALEKDQSGQYISRMLVDEALQRGSTDNITCMVILFKDLAPLE
jgi:serine/threonine protein phosphatase PrpC